jgi:hypothetical protein
MYSEVERIKEETVIVYIHRGTDEIINTSNFVHDVRLVGRIRNHNFPNTKKVLSRPYRIRWKDFSEKWGGGGGGGGV